ncbi:hypothetical protein ACHQM5_008859 [Ranunculus cassubicifolius]
MMEQIRDLQEDGEDDEDEFMKKDGSSNKGSSGNQKGNAPRSKHSETEQRRRSKINERFQILRDLLPPSDQKRDKASFLLEVIEYVQFLHERLHKYENQHGGKQELSKLAPWRYSYWTSEGMVENSRLVKNGPGKVNDSNVSIMPTMPLNIHNPVVDSDLKELPPTTPLQPNIYTPLGSNDVIVRPISDEDNISSQPSALWQTQPWNPECQTSETLNDQDDIVVEGGTINIASVYSQGLLNNLTQALQSSGVDLSQASISVQIDLGKRAVGRPTSSSKDPGDPSTINRGQTHSRDGSSGEDTNEGRKRHKP